MNWTGWAIALGAIAVLYVPLMAGLMVFALGWLFTPGRVNWAGPRRKDPFRNGFRGDPRSGLGLDFETVAVPTELGPAEGWLVPAGGGPLWALYVHGVGGLRENGLRQLSVLHEAGIPTLMIAYRNDPWGPKGTPPFYGFGINEWRDVEAAVQWARDHGAERIVLVAESMGAAIAGQFLKRSAEAGIVVSLLLDSPALDFRAVVRGYTRWVPLGRLVEAVGLRWARAVLPVDLATVAVADVVRDFEGPIFVAHGTGDPLVPVTVTRDLVRTRSGPTVHLETSAQHLQSWQADREGYRRGILSVLDAVRANRAVEVGVSRS